MLPLEDIEARRATIETSPDLRALAQHLRERAWPLLDRMPIVPSTKALLSRDGGICPEDGASLAFDPWSPVEHRCPSCGRTFRGARHDAHWARAQHLWLAERCAHLATLHVLDGDEQTATRARELLAGYYDLYHALPNRDNVLGPSHLFFSTYLESMWILDYLAAAFLLREVDALSPGDISAIDAIADEAATIIAEFNEGTSNRQVWNSAALTAIASWFGDEELALTAIEGRTGLLGQLADGFGADGMWHEGENYHLFAVRGLLIGLQWSSVAGAELLENAQAAAHLAQSLMAPADTSLPDFTFPARKDARFGVSLAQPAYLECWEAGLASLGDRSRNDAAAWLQALYRQPPRHAPQYDAWLHDAGQPLPASRGRADLSWWALWTMLPELPVPSQPWSGRSLLLPQQGLAVMRHDKSYVSLECGGGGSGHAHPDRLQLTMFADGVYWLPDPGTGSYVTRDLFWYRSTLAHNAPLLDGVDQPADDRARCDAFDARDGWSWASATTHTTRRTVVSGGGWTLDVLRYDGDARHRLELPWHFAGDLTMDTAGTWRPLDGSSEFVDQLAMFHANHEDGDPLHARLTAGEHEISAWFAGDGDVVRAVGPGLPDGGTRTPFIVRRVDANHATFATLLDQTGGVHAFEWQHGIATIRHGNSTATIQLTGVGAIVTRDASVIELAGLQPAPPFKIATVTELSPHAVAHALHVDRPPALDGSFEGFRLGAPLEMNEEYHYFRSESPYPGPDTFSAVAHVNWSDDACYVGVEVRKPDLVLRDADAPPLNYDNEPEDINADGIQLYLAEAAWLIVPAPHNRASVRHIGATDSAPLPTGRWQRTTDGYCVTLRIPMSVVLHDRGGRVPFDLIVNEMHPGRERRAGQLVWSGGPGWVYLRGDRQDPARFGELEFTG